MIDLVLTVTASIEFNPHRNAVLPTQRVDSDPSCYDRGVENVPFNGISIGIPFENLETSLRCSSQNLYITSANC